MTAANLVAVLALAMLCGFLYGLSRMTRRRTAPVEIDLVEKLALASPPSPRELRREEMRARMLRGVCANCSDSAEFPRPRLEPVRSFFDPILTWVGAIQPNRYRIDPTPLETPHSLCPRHHEQVRGHMEQEVAESVAAWSEFASRQRSRMYQVEAHVIDERIEHTMAGIRCGSAKESKPRAPIRAKALTVKTTSKALALPNGKGSANGNGRAS